MSDKTWSVTNQLERLAMGAEPLEDACRGIICKKCKTVRPLRGDTSGWKQDNKGYLLCPKCSEDEEQNNQFQQ